MTALDLATKTCGKCDSEQPLSNFYRYTRSADGHAWECKACAKSRVRESEQRRREEMGETAWREHRRSLVARSRENPEVRMRGHIAQDAYNAAIAALRDLHRDQFDALLRQERYDRGLDI